MKGSPYQAPASQAQEEPGKVRKLKYDKPLMSLILSACAVVIIATALAFTYRYRNIGAEFTDSESLKLHRSTGIIFLGISPFSLACAGLAAMCLLFKKHFKAGIISLVVLALMTLLCSLLFSQRIYVVWH